MGRLRITLQWTACARGATLPWPIRDSLVMEATDRPGGRLLCMGAETPNVMNTSGAPGERRIPMASSVVKADRAREVAALYRAHAVDLIRLGVVMLGDRPSAEDVVQEAFVGLYRRWDQLSDTGNALRYVRSSVLNGCRSVLRRRRRQQSLPGPGSAEPSASSAPSAESAVLIGEEHSEVLAALRRLPPRQREVLVLRFYLDVPEPEIARSMGISQGTVKSATSRGLAALGRLLLEDR